MEFLVLIKTRYSNIFDFVQQDDKINKKKSSKWHCLGNTPFEMVYSSIQLLL